MKGLAVFQSTFPRGERRFGVLFTDVITMISIHVPAWGTTSSSVNVIFSHIDFNPRSRVGNDLANRYYRWCLLYISIHVPAWGTTQDFLRPQLHRSNFNPRSRVGNDAWICQWIHYVRDFNPRSRVGNDQFSDSLLYAL